MKFCNLCDLAIFANIIDMSTKLDPFFRDAGLFIFRLVLGFLFVMHGWQNDVTKGWDAGLWSSDGGFEYVLVLGACALLLLLTGPGAVSVDKLLFGRKKNSSDSPAAPVSSEIAQPRDGVELTVA